MAYILGYFHAVLARSAAVPLILAVGGAEKLQNNCYEHHLHLGDHSLKVMLRFPAEM